MKKKKHRSYTILPLLALFVALATVGATLYAGMNPRTETYELSSARGERTPLSLWDEPASYSAPSPAPAEIQEEQGSSQEGDGLPYDELLVEEEGLRVYRVHGKRYRGILAVLDDPKRLSVGTLSYYGGPALTIEQIIAQEGAILGTNGGGFYDPNGEGSGNTPQGIVMVDGEYRWGGKYGEYDCLAITDEGEIITGRRTGEYLESRNTVYAVSYGPALIVDNVVQDLYISMPEPRTAVGQRENGQVLLLIVEGRQVGCVGVDLPTLAEIMHQLGAINATNLDGGASSAMYYRGTLLNRPNGLAGMRPMPTALLVAPLEEVGG